MTEPVHCVQSAQAAGEPLAGTAAEQRWWVFVEYRGAWSRRGFSDVALDRPVRYALSRLHRAGWRIQLIRQPGRTSSKTCLFALDAAEGRAWRMELTDIQAVGALPWSEIQAGGAPDLRVETPTYFVCTHGRRDRCCARLGIGLYQALTAAAGDGSVWQTTHLGGHRFAPTILTAPSGICYGRLVPSAAAGLVAAHEAGQAYDVAYWRGRCGWSRPAQAAEIALRARSAPTGLSALQLEGCVQTRPGAWDVTISGTVLSVRVAAGTQPVIKSCGEDAMPVERLEVVR